MELEIAFWAHLNSIFDAKSQIGNVSVPDVRALESKSTTKVPFLGQMGFELNAGLLVQIFNQTVYFRIVGDFSCSPRPAFIIEFQAQAQRPKKRMIKRKRRIANPNPFGIDFWH